MREWLKDKLTQAEAYLEDGTEAGKQIAKELLKSIMEQGELSDDSERDEVRYWLGHIYLYRFPTSFYISNEKKREIELGRDIMMELADKGDTRAMFELGLLYENHNWSAYEDFDKAVYWYCKAWENGHSPEAVGARLFDLMGETRKMRGKPGKESCIESCRKALGFLRSYEDSKDPSIRYRLGLAEAMAGNVEPAMMHLGFATANSKSVERYINDAVEEQIAQICLNEEDVQTAVKWLEIAQAQDDGEPPEGRELDEGTVAERLLKKMVWHAGFSNSWSRASVRGFLEAATESADHVIRMVAWYFLADLTLRADSTAFQEARRYLERAAELGYGMAMCRLGKIHMEAGGEENYQKGLEWYEAAKKFKKFAAHVDYEAGVYQAKRRREAVRKEVQRKFAELGLTEEKVQKLEKSIVIGKQHFDRLIFRSGLRRGCRNGSTEDLGPHSFTEVKVEDIKAGKIEGCFYADAYPGISFCGIALVDDYAYTREGELINMSRPYMVNSIPDYDTEAVINCTPFWGSDPLRSIPGKIRVLMREADPDADADDMDEVRRFLALMELKGDDAPEAFLSLKENGDETVCVMLAESYENGICGLTKDEEKAAELYRKAAEQGDCDACARLGDLYRTGRGVTPNHRQALSWYDRAISKLSYNRSQRGVAIAWIGKGLLYCEGRGEVEDALELWEKVADSEFPVESARARELLDAYDFEGQEEGDSSLPLPKGDPSAAFSDDPNDLFDMWIEYQKYLDQVEKTGDGDQWEDAIREAVLDYMKMGDACRKKGALYNAPAHYLYNEQDHYHKACTLEERLCEKTGAAEDLLYLVYVYYSYGEACMVSTDMDEAGRYFRKAFDLGEKLLTEEGRKSVRMLLALCCLKMGSIREFDYDYSGAKELYKKAVVYLEELYEEEETPDSCEYLALYCYTIGVTDPDALEKDYLQRALEMYRRLLELDSENEEAKEYIPIIEELLEEE